MLKKLGSNSLNKKCSKRKNSKKRRYLNFLKSEDHYFNIK